MGEDGVLHRLRKEVLDTTGRVRLRIERTGAGWVWLRIERGRMSAGEEEEGEERDQFELEHLGGVRCLCLCEGEMRMRSGTGGKSGIYIW